MDWASLVSFILTSYVDYPSAVCVTAHREKYGETLVIEVDVRDRGQVIGKGGRNLQAIERLMAFYQTKSNVRLPRLELQG
jgi:predicted RNA-binding protein YlqC (UPF0109 family)